MEGITGGCSITVKDNKNIRYDSNMLPYAGIIRFR